MGSHGVHHARAVASAGLETSLRTFRELLRRLWGTFRRNPTDRDLEEELEFHLDLVREAGQHQGGTPEEARRAARLHAGGVAQAMEALRDQRGLPRLDDLSRDVRYAIRTLRRSPSFTITVVLTLALGIGANTAMFSAIDAILLRPLPFPDGDRLMRLRQIQERTAETYIAPVRLEDWQRLNVAFDAITGYFMEDVSETSGELPQSVRRAFVGPRFLEVWRIRPAVGRGFTDAEHTTGGPAAVLISDRYWRVRFGADPNVLGRLIRIGTASFPVIGVMPASFLFPDRDVDLWFPSAVDNTFAQSRQATWYAGIGRLKRGVTLPQARANMEAVQARLAEQYPETDAKLRVDLTPLKETTVAGIRRSLWLLFGGVSLLLLITCTNVAGLLLTRTAHRHQEISVRIALGGSPLAIAGQMFVEVLVLSVVGASMGLLFAAWATAALRAAAAGLPRIDEVTIDGRILLYTLVSAVVVALFCGTLPALRSGRADVTAALSDGKRTQVSARTSLQWLLVGAQVALSVMLLAGAGLLLRSFQQLSRVDAGFSVNRMLSFRISGNFGETANYDRLIARIDGTIDALQALPGVDAVATAGFLPGLPVQFESAFALVEATSETEQRMVAESRPVSPEYFDTMQIPLKQGTPCRRQPRGAAEVMVNSSFVTRYLAARSSPTGLHLISGNTNPRPSVITGVVGDAREAGLDRQPVPTVYSCMSAPNPTPYFLLRTHGEPQALAQTVRLKIKEREPLRSVYDVAPLEQRIDGAFAQNRLRTVLLVAFALAALSLACVGVYGTLSHVVSLRRREVGLRLALGAARSGVVRHFLLQAVRVVGVACLAGLALSFAFARLLAGMLYGVSAADPFVLVTIVAIVMAVATLASLVPASRAAFVEPMQVLREG